ncbi:YcaO-like family protein, partial [Glutamicibacter ardleyensis]
EHRADRRYLQDAGEQFEAVRDLGAHVQVWLDPQMHALAERFRAPAGGLVDIETVAGVPMEEVHRSLARAGHQVYTRELTTEDVALTGLSVVRVVVGGLVPNAPAAFAYLRCPRVAGAAVSRGWRDVPPVAPGDFTLAPPPHM